MIYDLIIIGAGASGLFAAANTDETVKTLVIEKNSRPGIKLLMTGSGQCNLTHDGDIKNFLNKYNNPKFIRKILYSYNNNMLMDYFESKGIKLLIREDGKVFPASLKAQDILNLLLEETNKRNHKIIYNKSINQIKWENNQKIFHISSSDEKFSSRKIILAGGGKSYPLSGSDGSLMNLVEQIGVKVNNQKPALTSVSVYDYIFSSISGLSVENVKIKIRREESLILERVGDLLFTHFDLSGPVIINSSRNIKENDIIEIDFLQEHSLKELEEIINFNISKNTKKEIKNILEDSIKLPKRLLEILIKQSEIIPAKTSSEISKSEIKNIIDLCKNFRVKVKMLGGFNKAMITAGGVDIKEIDNKTMSWIKNPSLYFIGEMIDIDGETGGYNLQFAFSSAMKSISSLVFD